MRIVVSTIDGNRISSSFGGCNVFSIYEISNGRIIKKMLRLNSSSRIGREPVEKLDGEPVEIPRSRNIVDRIGDCEVVICHRMRRGNWLKMGKAGIEMIFTSVNNAENAVIRYLSGELKDEYQQIMNY